MLIAPLLVTLALAPPPHLPHQVPADSPGDEQADAVAQVPSAQVPADSRRESAPATIPTPPQVSSAEQTFQQALAAEQSGDWARYRELVELTVDGMPDPTRLLYRLAGARLRAGDREGAIEAFRRQIDAEILRDPRPDPVFAPLLSDPRFAVELSRLDALSEPLTVSSEAFRLPDGDLIEGIAFDQQTGAVYLSSVRGRKILRRSKEGAIDTFVPTGTQGLRGALGLAVDPERRLLWVVSVGLPHAAELPAEQRGRSSLIAFDLETGAVRSRVDAPAGEHLWNDLALARDGTVYASDPVGKAVHRIRPNGTIETVIQGNGLRSPGGLALSGGETLLYVADWIVGLAVVDLASGELTWMPPPARSTTLGIDGLLRRGTSLYAIHNGVTPARVSRFALSSDGRALARAETLERAHPLYDEPTLGVLVGNQLWYVANSHWPRFDDQGQLRQGATLEPTVVLSLPIGTSR